MKLGRYSALYQLARAHFEPGLQRSYFINLMMEYIGIRE